MPLKKVRFGSKAKAIYPTHYMYKYVYITKTKTPKPRIVLNWWSYSLMSILRTIASYKQQSMGKPLTQNLPVLTSDAT